MENQQEKQINLDEIVLATRESLEYNAKEEDLIIAIDKAVEESRSLHEEIQTISGICEEYWRRGTNVDLAKVHPKKSKIVNNRIYMSLETIIPIITSDTPEPTVLGEIPNSMREKLQNVLKLSFETDFKGKKKSQVLTRHWALSRLGILKYKWDTKCGYKIDNVLTERVGIDPFASEKGNCEYMWEILEDDLGTLIEKYPKKKTELEGKYGNNPKKKLRYLEFWGGNGEWVSHKIENILLDKKKNPNYDYDNEENNLFNKPQFPYILLSVFKIGRTVYDDSSLVEQAIPLQDGINKLENQILDLNEGQKRVWACSADAMSDETFQDLINRTGDLGIRYDGKTPAGGIQLPLSGKPDASLYNDLTHLIGEIDNIMGTHSTTRGERKESETLGGRQLMVASDYGRLDMIVANLEEVWEEVYNSFLHMTKILGTEEIKISTGEKGVAIAPEDIPKGVKVMVKKGSSLPTDDKSRMEMAVELAGMGMIDPGTLFEELGYGDEEERTKKLMEWLQMTGKIVQQQAPMQNPDLQRLQSAMSSSKFQDLSPEEQAKMVEQGRQIVKQVKQGNA